jgi:hypothetical protein
LSKAFAASWVCEDSWLSWAALLPFVAVATGVVCHLQSERSKWLEKHDVIVTAEIAGFAGFGSNKTYVHKSPAVYNKIPITSRRSPISLVPNHCRSTACRCTACRYTECRVPDLRSTGLPDAPTTRSPFTSSSHRDTSRILRRDRS